MISSKIIGKKVKHRDESESLVLLAYANDRLASRYLLRLKDVRTGNVRSRIYEKDGTCYVPCEDNDIVSVG